MTLTFPKLTSAAPDITPGPTPSEPALFAVSQSCEGLHLYGYEYRPVSEEDPSLDIEGVKLFDRPERYDTLFDLLENLPLALAWLKQDKRRLVDVVLTDESGDEAARCSFSNPDSGLPDHPADLPVRAFAVPCLAQAQSQTSLQRQERAVTTPDALPALAA